MAEQIQYRVIRNYKYQLMNDYSIDTNIRPVQEIVEPKPPTKTFIRLIPSGRLTVYQGYAWDGPSGPTIDTKNFMRGSLVHDALYQLIRQTDIGLDHRIEVDELLRAICLKDGMSSFRAWYVYHALRLFGEAQARPRGEEEVEILIAP